MGRPPRIDFPGAWHHVMNRGLAKRRIFESTRDVRLFLSLVAREVRRGGLEVHSYCLMSSHFHALVRSPVGELSRAWQRIESPYVRWFNAQRGRDGALFRGRFRSKPVEFDLYQRMLVRYIDFNPVEAGIVADPADYPWGSAHSFCGNRHPPWLATGWILDQLGLPAGTDGEHIATAYRRTFGKDLPPEHRSWIRDRALRRSWDEDPVAVLFDAPPDRIARWFEARAELADGVHAGFQVVPPDFVESALQRSAPALDSIRLDGDLRLRPSDLLRAGVLRDLCALSHREAAVRMSLTTMAARNRYLRHRELLRRCPAYAEMLSRFTTWTLRGFLAG